MIGEAIESVSAQNYPGFEHIIIDGGSTDGTVDLLAKYPHIQLVSGPDKGMYDALNKGLRRATGEIIGFLNSDDFYEPRIFSQIVHLFDKKNVDAVIGSTKFFLDGSANLQEHIFQPTPPQPSKYWHDLILGSPCFNAWFFRKSVFDCLGWFDFDYKIAGDRDFLLRFALEGLCYERFKGVVYHYRYHQGSLTMNQDWLHVYQVINENLRLINDFFDDTRMPRFARKQLCQLRTRETITAASRSIRSGNWRQAKTYSMLGFGYDRFWPAKFVVRIVIGIARTIAGRFMELPPQI